MQFLLVVLVLTPCALRMLIDLAMDQVGRHRRSIQPSDEPLVTQEDSGWTVSNAHRRGLHLGKLLGPGSPLPWAEARAGAELSTTGAASIACCKLLFCHLLQPAAYALAFAACRPSLGLVQLTFAVAVGMREAVHALCALVACQLCPAFLLVDVVATWDPAGMDGLRSSCLICNHQDVLLLIVAPAIFVQQVVARAATGRADGLLTLGLPTFGLMCIELLAAIALLITLPAWRSALPLVLSYAVSTVGVAYVAWWTLTRGPC